MVYTITQHMQIPLTTITSTILLLMPGLMFNCMFTINLQIITLLTHIIHIHLVSLIMMDMAIISTIKLMATTSILFIQQRVMEVEVEQSQQLLYFFVASLNFRKLSSNSNHLLTFSLNSINSGFWSVNTISPVSIIIKDRFFYLFCNDYFLPFTLLPFLK